MPNFIRHCFVKSCNHQPGERRTTHAIPKFESVRTPNELLRYLKWISATGHEQLCIETRKPYTKYVCYLHFRANGASVTSSRERDYPRYNLRMGAINSYCIKRCICSSVIAVEREKIVMRSSLYPPQEFVGPFEFVQSPKVKFLEIPDEEGINDFQAANRKMTPLEIIYHDLLEKYQDVKKENDYLRKLLGKNQKC